MKKIRTLLSIVFGLTAASLNTSCGEGTGIFPEVVTSTSESEAVLPNPVSIAIDQANGQIVVANSNVDIFFAGGSLSVLAVDATTPAAPVLSGRQTVETPNFAGELFFHDASDALFVPFREASAADDDVDLLHKYTLSAAGALTLADETTVEANPFGITGSGSTLYVVSDEVLSILNTDLTPIATVDLTRADDQGIDDSDALHVEYVALDAARNRAFVSNIGGRLFVVDLATNALVQAVSGPTATRNLIIDGNTLYALDPAAELVWIFDLSELDAPTTSPVSVDDSLFLLGTVSVGNNPNGMALDSANNRLYVANSDDNTISVVDTLVMNEIARLSTDPDDLTDFNRGGEFPFGLALGTFNGTQYLFVACFSSNAVLMINTDTLRVVEVYPNNALNL